VHIHSGHLGRGPAKAYAFFRQNVVVVLLEDGITKGEQSLVDDGRLEAALRMRRDYQETMRTDLVDAVENLTACSVVAFMSDNHFDPDLGVELFVLDRWVPGVQGPKNDDAAT
jgi:uncharacterized protein YbcI